MDLIGAAAARLNCYYLTGTFVYKFANDSGRTVKLHLSDDESGVASANRLDYFLTVPAKSEGVEVPMKSGMICVTAGFYRPEDGSYEIFWENRRFAWEQDATFCARAQHSVQSNMVRADVFPGAPEVPRGTCLQEGKHCFRMLMGETLDLKDVRVFSQRALEGPPDKRKAMDLRLALADGSLQLVDEDKQQHCVEPLRHATLMSLPRAFVDAAVSRGNMLLGQAVGGEDPSCMAPAPRETQYPYKLGGADTLTSSYAPLTLNTLKPSFRAPMQMPSCSKH